MLFAGTLSKKICIIPLWQSNDTWEEIKCNFSSLLTTNRVKAELGTYPGVKWRKAVQLVLQSNFLNLQLWETHSKRLLGPQDGLEQADRYCIITLHYYAIHFLTFSRLLDSTLNIEMGLPSVLWTLDLFCCLHCATTMHTQNAVFFFMFFCWHCITQRHWLEITNQHNVHIYSTGTLL